VALGLEQRGGRRERAFRLDVDPEGSRNDISTVHVVQGTVLKRLLPLLIPAQWMKTSGAAVEFGVRLHRQGGVYRATNSKSKLRASVGDSCSSRSKIAGGSTTLMGYDPAIRFGGLPKARTPMLRGDGGPTARGRQEGPSNFVEEKRVLVLGKPGAAQSFRVRNARGAASGLRSCFFYWDGGKRDSGRKRRARGRGAPLSGRKADDRQGAFGGFVGRGRAGRSRPPFGKEYRRTPCANPLARRRRGPFSAS